MSEVHLRHYFFIYNFQSAKSHYQHQNTHNNRLVGKINPQAVFADFVKQRDFEFKIFCKIFLCDEIPKIKACRKEENPRNNREIVCRHKVGRGESQKCKVLARIEKIGQFYDIQPEKSDTAFLQIIRNRIKRGVLLNLAGFAVTCVTVIAEPNQAVWFGVLNLIGCSC